MSVLKTPALIIGKVLLIGCLTACGGSSGSDDNRTPLPPAPPEGFTYTAPDLAGDGWGVASARDLGMDVSFLESMMDNIYAQAFGYRRMDGVAIAYKGQLIFDSLIRRELDMTDEWAGNTNVRIHSMHSVTKSIMSLTMGIAIEQGLVGSINESALSYFPDYAPYGGQSELKSSATIEDWLTMQHGFEWDEWNVNYQEDTNQNLRMINSSDPLGFLFNTPASGDPGTTYAYSTGVSYALGEIIVRASDMNLFEYMQLNIFNPMGIQDVDHWEYRGDLHAGSGLYLTLRDMAKIGQMVLDEGQWQGMQIVPQNWIATSIEQKLQSGNIRYAYQWWINDFTANGQDHHAVYASGWGGQFIFIFPELEAVILMMGHRYEDGQSEQTSVRRMLQDHILPMLLSAE